MAAPRCLEDERQILFGENNPVAHPMIENWQAFAAGHQPGGLADFPRGLAFPHARRAGFCDLQPDEKLGFVGEARFRPDSQSIG
jgi:hypothetical protein